MRTKPQKINIVTLGCSKNLVDSEQLMKQIQSGGIQVVHNENGTSADTVIINTCGFIHDAKEESIDTILGYAEAKQQGDIQNLYVMGCMSERYKPELAKEIPNVDAFFGANNIEDIVKSLQLEYRKDLLGERVLTTPSHYGYLKVSEGCDRECGFCAIPLMRGKHRSVPIPDLEQSVRSMVAQGTKEIMLIAQDLSYYGKDLYRTFELPQLVDKLSSVPGVEWLRLHYAYPANFPMAVLDLMRERDNICKYMDIPLQHISENMLKQMRRGYGQQKTIEVIQAMRDRVPGIALRTTLLTGYPGETDADFEALKTFVKETRFDRLGIFTYSDEEDTYAYNKLTDKVPEELMHERANEIMEIQQGISEEINKAKIGQTFKVLVDREEEDFFVGRTEFDSPEVDNEVLIDKETGNVRVGEFCNVKVTDSSEFDLYGEAVAPA